MLNPEPNPDPCSVFMLDPDPYKKNTDISCIKNCLFFLLCCGDGLFGEKPEKKFKGGHCYTHKIILKNWEIPGTGTLSL